MVGLRIFDSGCVSVCVFFTVVCLSGTFRSNKLEKRSWFIWKEEKKLARCHELFVNNGVEGMRICQGVNANIYTKKSWNPWTMSRFRNVAIFWEESKHLLYSQYSVVARFPYLFNWSSWKIYLNHTVHHVSPDFCHIDVMTI